MKLFLIFAIGFSLIICSSGGKFFTKALVDVASWSNGSPTAVPYIGSFESCALYCMEHTDLCNAFEFSNGVCSISLASTFFKYSKTSLIEKTIWYDKNSVKINIQTMKTSKSFASVQADGNFMLFDGEGGFYSAWGTNTGSNYLKLQSDGNLIVFKSSGAVVRATNAVTSC